MNTTTKGPDEKHCHECGAVIRARAEICPQCGMRQPALPGQPSGAPGYRRCTACGFTGPMKTWLRNYNVPQFVALFLLFLWIVPGLIFIAWHWGRYKCPNCGKVGENAPA